MYAALPSHSDNTEIATYKKPNIWFFRIIIDYVECELMRLKKRGQQTSPTHFPIELIVVILVLVVAVVLFTNTSKAAQKGLSCANGAGVCKAECDAGEREYPFDIKITCGVGQYEDKPKCCMSKDKKVDIPSTVDPMCANRNPGQAGCLASEPLAYVCDDAKQCVTRCEFCARNPTNPYCQIKSVNKQVQFNDKWICGCQNPAPGFTGPPGPDTCVALSSLNPPKCIQSASFGGTGSPPTGFSTVMCAGGSVNLYCCEKP
jgi:hypothetical protein